MKKDLSPAKRALLEKWLQGQQKTQPKPGIPPRPEGEAIPLSFPQQRQLFLEMLDRGTAVNNLSVLLRMAGDLNLEALEKSANQILARHEALRTSFAFGMGMPTPEVAEKLTLPIPVVELAEGDRDEQRARQLAEKEVLVPFDLAKAPLIRLKIYRISPLNHLLLVIAHHTVADGWSLGVFLKELMQLYWGEVNGQSADIAPLAIQYGDYAHWQTRPEQLQKLTPSLEYWKKQLAGELPTLELPTDRPRGARQTFTGGTHRFVLSKTLTERLEALGRKQDATLFMTLLTGFYLLLHRYSGQQDLMVGTPIANRNHPELQSLMGVFINTLVLRTPLDRQQSFVGLLGQVRQTCVDAYAHQDYPFEKLVEELKPRRDLSRPPLFQVVFNLQSSPLPKLEMPGLEADFMDLDRGVSQFDLTLMMSRIEGACHATVEYNADLFEGRTIERMFEAYQLLLNDAVQRPSIPVPQLNWIPPAMRRELVEELNQTEMDFPRDRCVHQLFEAQVEQTPEAVACKFEGNALTYRQLNAKVNALARQLQEAGAVLGTRIGILMNRSVEVPISMLAVHKAGGIYVPIHTSFPDERVRFILGDAAIEVLLTNVEVAFDGVEVLRVESEQLGEAPNLPPIISPEDLAYIIYTSGSTGVPKGVMVQHRPLVNFLWSMREKPGLQSGDILMAVTALSFDISGLELFLPLICGASVVIASEEMITNPLLLGEAIQAEKVTVMQATPAVWQLLIDTGWKGDSQLKALCGGEQLTRKLANKLLTRVGSLWNMYGPTETTIWSSVSQMLPGNAPIDVGTPIGNTTMYILDRDLQPLPTGVVGELYIGGTGLALGYQNRKELTQERFIPNPFSPDTASRLYKTGDLARFLPNHQIEILGRTDHQVKVNGHRIELGELSSVLAQHRDIQDAVVVVRQDTRGARGLVGYVVATPGNQPESSELRDFMRTRLPSYMTPSVFVYLDALPLSPSGKIDRKALPLPEDPQRSEGYVAPRTEVESILVSIWQHVLEVEQVGVHDNFFDLGGASIQSIQVVAKANMYGYPLSVEHMFEYQTIAELAKVSDPSDQ